MIEHRFRNTRFGDGFCTQNAILHTPYKPKVLILGTFNPDTDIEDNVADFFYGRNYFWPAFFNLFEYCEIRLHEKRETSWPNFDPTLPQILSLCERIRLTFADLIESVLHNDAEHLQGNNSNKIWYEGDCYNLIDDPDLARLQREGQVQWSTDPLTEYLNDSGRSVEFIYFTRQVKAPFSHEIRDIEHNTGKRISKIYTPSGRRLTNPKVSRLIEHWLHNENPGTYDRLDHNWLMQHDVPFE